MTSAPALIKMARGWCTSALARSSVRDVRFTLLFPTSVDMLEVDVAPAAWREVQPNNAFASSSAAPRPAILGWPSQVGVPTPTCLPNCKKLMSLIDLTFNG